MFIKEAYERRQKQGDHEQEVLNAEPKIHKIGSIKNHKMDYDIDEQFFSVEEIPKNAYQKKQEVLEDIDPDILGLRKKKWNNSVAVPKNPLSEETHERKLVKIRLGLFDHPIPKERDNIIYQGTETRNFYILETDKGTKKWEVSTELNKQLLEQQLKERTEQSLLKNKADIIKNYIKPPEREYVDMNNATLTKKQMIDHEAEYREHLKAVYYFNQYVKPTDVQTQITTDTRRQKSQERELREELRREFIKANPKATREAIDGAVFRLAYEEKLKKNQSQIQNKDITFKADLSKTLKHDIIIKYYHNGVWAKQPDGNEGWSCCMANEFDAQGCYKQKIDKNKWDYSSFNH